MLPQQAKERQENLERGRKQGSLRLGSVGPTTEKWTMESGLTEGGRGRGKLVRLDRTGEARSGRLPEVAMMEAADFGNLDDHAEFRRLDWPPGPRQNLIRLAQEH